MTSGSGYARWVINGGAVTVGYHQVQMPPDGPTSIVGLDAIAAGTHTYAAQVWPDNYLFVNAILSLMVFSQ